MDHPKFIVLNQKEESISIQRVKAFNVREHSGSVVECLLDLSRKGHGLEPHWCHCAGVLEQKTLILAKN